MALWYTAFRRSITDLALEAASTGFLLILRGNSFTHKGLSLRKRSLVCSSLYLFFFLYETVRKDLESRTYLPLLKLFVQPVLSFPPRMN